MPKFALYAHLKAKPGKENDLEAFLKSALPLAEKETGTVTWYAFQEDQGAYGIFDTFDTEQARQAHLDGPIAKALMSKAEELLSSPPAIHKIRLLAAKIPK
ncbi:MAG TPA: antibiotic biosynthesis monooxygenase [Tepidisphaeraceae bacterium]|jgi:quinol monooxygenase YgiN|nr:antibiotic biosynthesis monooxygenase [Tepidisphaeraceae bacterium]